jgi:hypothetical protein
VNTRKASHLLDSAANQKPNSLKISDGREIGPFEIGHTPCI